MEFSASYIPRRRKIGLTALIDVVFIMLMFFMLTSSFEQWKTIQIDSPISKFQTSMPTLPQFIVLESSGQLYPLHQESEAISYSDLTLDSWDEIDIKRPVLLLPEPNVRLQQIISVIEKLRQIGMAEVSLGDPYRKTDQMGANE